ncbi:MAG: efflux RND transporter periplasmic adaptor subunit [Roseobacter sp.]|uniref:efflux RND transporter periplasmic adaptor subunit n=1 Tax=Alphaproteobacteria TaxID=28211 RepID=UPI003264BAE8
MRRLVSIVAALIIAGAATHAQTLTSTAEGTVVPARSWDVSAEVSNKIRRLHFTTGQLVQKGDLLVEFDTVFKKFDVELAKIALDKATTNMASANEALERQEKLRQSAAASEVSYNAAKHAADKARADHRAANTHLEMAEAILSIQKLYAPFDGQMSAPKYRENANVNIDEGPEISTLVQLDPIHVQFEVPYDRVFARMSAGETEAEIAASQIVVISLPNGAQYPHEGKLISGGYEINSENGTQLVLVEFANPDRILRPGLLVTGSGFER